VESGNTRSASRTIWLPRATACLVIFLGTIGLIATVALGVFLYQLGSVLGETWERANAGLRQSSVTLVAARDSLTVTGKALTAVEEGIGEASAAAGSTNQGLIATEEFADSLSNSLAALAVALETAGDAFSSTGELGSVGVSLGEAGAEATDASRDVDSLQPVWQVLPGGTGLNAAENFTDSLSSSLAALGVALEAAGDALRPTGELGRVGISLGQAGEEASEASRNIDSLRPRWRELRDQTDGIRQVLKETGTEIPRLTGNLAEVSQGLEGAALTLDTIADDLEALRQSRLFIWLLIAGTAYFSAISCSLILVGTALLLKSP
jgi:hypothetical protein